MRLGMIGLGRMGANLVRRLMRDGHEAVVFDVSPEAVAALASEGAVGIGSVAEFAAKLEAPRVVWLMIPAGLTGRVVDEVAAVLEPGDIIIDGGNSNYRDDVRRAAKLKETRHPLRRRRHQRRRLRPGARVLPDGGRTRRGDRRSSSRS